MEFGESYQALSALLDYPLEKERLVASLSTVAAHMDRRGLKPVALPFGDFLKRLTLPQLQEEFVGCFDFNPAKAPYLGHHLYGDNQKKAAFMIMLKEQYADHGFAPNANELPDHLAVVLNFLSHLSREGKVQYRRQFIANSVLPGVRKLAGAGAERNPSPWQPVIEAAELLLAEDCKEVSR